MNMMNENSHRVESGWETKVCGFGWARNRWDHELDENWMKPENEQKWIKRIETGRNLKTGWELDAKWTRTEPKWISAHGGWKLDETCEWMKTGRKLDDKWTKWIICAHWTRKWMLRGNWMQTGWNLRMDENWMLQESWIETGWNLWMDDPPRNGYQSE